MKAIMNSTRAKWIFTIIKSSYLFKMEFIRENKTYKEWEKAMVNVSGVMDHIMRGNGRMDREMVLECSSKDKA